jgi:hypothetical protein
VRAMGANSGCSRIVRERISQATKAVEAVPRLPTTGRDMLEIPRGSIREEEALLGGRELPNPGEQSGWKEWKQRE